VSLPAPSNPTTGPLLHATLTVADAAPFVAAYAHLGLVVLHESRVAEVDVAGWGAVGVALVGRRRVDLGPLGAAAPLLRLIVLPGTPPRPTRWHHGWLALEILVRDVDALAARLAAAGGGGFELVGAPADLELSPAIRAMQLVGPAGEMLYLTQVKAAVPPFEIPLSSPLPAPQDLGPLFIAVMSCPSREQVLASCTPLGAGRSLQFETRITVLNRALGHPLDMRWPVATVQWAGECLFEIDEVLDPALRPPPLAAGVALPAGLAWVTIQSSSAPAGLRELAPGAWLECLPASAH
jgi:hypothetical protein